jgi:hypothetical protein
VAEADKKADAAPQVLPDAAGDATTAEVVSGETPAA